MPHFELTLHALPLSHMSLYSLSLSPSLFRSLPHSRTSHSLSLSLLSIPLSPLSPSLSLNRSKFSYIKALPGCIISTLAVTLPFFKYYKLYYLYIEKCPWVFLVESGGPTLSCVLSPQVDLAISHL